MKHWGQKYHILFIALISSWAIIFPTYGLYYSLEEMDVFRSPHWENLIQEPIGANIDKKWTGSGWILGEPVVSQEKELLNLFKVLGLSPSPPAKMPVLRC